MRKLMKLMIILMILTVALPVLAVAQREYPCFQLPGEPVLDGKLEDAVWQNIPEATGFFVLGGSKVAVERQTFFKAGWTTNALYFAIRCIEPTPDKIKANQADDGNLCSEDDLEFFFLPPGSGAAMQLIVNARGSRWNGKEGQREELLDWQAAASIGSNEWYAEVKVPFNVLRKTPIANETWKFSIARTVTTDFTGAERYTCWPRLLKVFDEAPNFAALAFKRTLPAETEMKEQERQMNNPGLILQKVLQSVVQNVSPRYKEFERKYGKFEQEGLAGQKLKDEAVALRKDMESMEKAATAKEPDMKAIEAALTVNLSDRLMNAISNCCIRVSIGTIVDNPLLGDEYTVEWNLPADAKSSDFSEAARLTFDCPEKTIFGKPVVRMDYSWTGNKQKGGAGNGKNEARASGFYFWFGDKGRAFPGKQPRLGLWVHGNGSSDKLMCYLPVDWEGWRYVELTSPDFSPPWAIGSCIYSFSFARANQTGAREPLYFGPGVFYGQDWEIPDEMPASPYPFPFYLAQNEMLSIPINGGNYDVEIGLDKRVTDGKIPEIYINDVFVNENPTNDIVTYQCEVKDGVVYARSACRGHCFSGIKYIKLSRQNRTIAYCDATVMKQNRKFAERDNRNFYYVFNTDPTISSLETNCVLFEQELGAKQLAADPRIVYQFKLDPGEYRVRLRFNRWRGTYPETAAKFDVYLQGDKVMEIRKPNRELLVRDFAVKVTNDYMQAALLGAGQDACAWLGDISIYQGEQMIGFVQPRASMPESLRGDYYGLRNLVPNPSFEVEGWQRIWASISSANKPVRTNSFAHHGDWSMCLERTTGPAGLLCNNSDTILQKIRTGNIAKVSADEKLFDCGVSGAPVDYTKTYRFTGWVKAEEATGKTYLQVIWLAAPRKMLDEKPLLPDFPKYRPLKTYSSILRIDESSKISGTHDWRKLIVEARPPYGATQARFVLRSDDNRGKAYFDDLDFDGFGSEPLEIVLPQVGYHPRGEKLAFVKTREPVKEGKFQLDDVNGKTTYSSKIKPIGIDSWGIYVSKVDFSSCRVEGQYTLKVTAKELPDRVTPSFIISSNLYRDLGMLSITGYFHIARCGFEVPGWHPACHLDDAAIRNGYACGNQPEYLNTNKPKGEIIKHVDLTGGWHDAGSLDKYGHGIGLAVVNMCRFWEDTHYVSCQLKEKYPDVLSEACWGIDYLMRTIDKQAGKIYDAPIEWDPITRDYQCLGSDPTDNIINTADDRVCRSAKDLESETNAASGIPSVLTRFAGLVREYDQSKADSLLETAGMWNANNMALALARYLINGKKKEDESLLEQMAAKKLAVYCSAKHPCFLPLSSADMDYVLLFDYLEACPDAKIKDDFKVLTRRICDEIIKPLADNNVYGVADQIGEPVMTRAFNPAEKNMTPNFTDPALGVSPAKYLQDAYFLIRAGRLLNDPELVRLAERHVQYVLGRNPTGLSMVNGAGYKVYSLDTSLYPYGAKWIELKGQMPGAVGSLFAFSTGSRDWLYSLGPLDFPIPQTASELIDTISGNGEVWEMPAGWFIAACGALDRALREMGR